nr:MAG TPA_asm: hypothetical protein [Caudoviricetes sp.]
MNECSRLFIPQLSSRNLNSKQSSSPRTFN